MYKLFYLAVFAISFNVSNINAQENNDSNFITQALERAKKEKKQVFINYYTSSCANSKKMKKQMKSKTFKSVFKSNYVIVNIEVPKEQTSEYVNCSNPVKTFSGNNCEVIKFPFWYVLDEKGDFTGSSFKNDNSNTGYPTTKEDVSYFISVIRSTSEITENKLNLIADSF